jgi:hypothetical protein
MKFSFLPVFNPSASCSGSNFQLGLLDWVWELFMTDGEASSLQEPPSRRRAPPLGLALIVAFAFITALGMAVGHLLPSLAKSRGDAGIAFLGNSALAMSGALLVLLVVVMPLFALVKTVRFCRRMCDRGSQLAAGKRIPVRVQRSVGR